MKMKSLCFNVLNPETCGFLASIGLVSQFCLKIWWGDFFKNIQQIKTSTNLSNWSNFKFHLRLELKVQLQPKTKPIHNSSIVGATVTLLLLYSCVDTIEEFFLLQILECSYHFIHRLWKSVNDNHSVSIEPCIVTSGDWWRCVCCCCCCRCFSQCQCLLLYL